MADFEIAGVTLDRNDPAEIGLLERVVQHELAAHLIAYDAQGDPAQPKLRYAQVFCSPELRELSGDQQAAMARAVGAACVERAVASPGQLYLGATSRLTVLMVLWDERLRQHPANVKRYKIEPKNAQ